MNETPMDRRVPDPLAPNNEMITIESISPAVNHHKETTGTSFESTKDTVDSVSVRTLGTSSSNSTAHPAPQALSTSSLMHQEPLTETDMVNEGRRVLVEFLKTAKAYDIIPESNKVIVFDTQVSVRLAFYALVEHQIPFAPLWDSDRCCFSGLMTTSDIVDIMRVFYTPGTGVPASAALSELTIAGWRAFAASTLGTRHSRNTLGIGTSPADSRGRSHSKGAEGSMDIDSVPPSSVESVGQAPNFPNTGQARDTLGVSATARDRALRQKRRIHAGLISVDPEDTLWRVCQKLRRHRVHHLPVLDADESCILAVLSYRSLLQYILQKFSDNRKFFHQSLVSLGIGSFEDVVVVSDTTALISVLNVLAERQISSVPIVNAQGVVVDIYCKDDVTFLSNDPTLQVLDAPIKEVRRAQIDYRGPWSPLVTCHRNETLHRCLELLSATGGWCERLVCVDEQRRCTGIVSISDIFRFLLQYEEI